MLWCILWLALVGDSPQTDRRIGQKEKDFIVNSLKGQSSSLGKVLMAISYKNEDTVKIIYR